MFGKWYNNYMERLFGDRWHGESRYNNVEVIDKLYRGPDEHLPYLFYFNDLDPGKARPGAKEHIMVVAASEQDITPMDWFQLAVGSRWKVSLVVIKGKLRIRSAMWPIREGEA